MKTLIIKDLAHTADLDASAMSAVRGGMRAPSHCDYGCYFPKASPDVSKSFNNTEQWIDQKQLNNVSVGDTAFMGKSGSISIDFHPTQTATNRNFS